MIGVDRKKARKPSILDKPNNAGKTELQRAKEHFDRRTEESFEFARYKAQSVKTELESLFHGKCAYCESYYAGTQPVDVEHYRPKGKVEEDETHPGYWWLAMDWENLLPSCIDCNRRRNQKAVRIEDLKDPDLPVRAAYDRSKKLSVGKACAFPLDDEATRGTGPTRGQPINPDRSYIEDERPLLIDPSRQDPADDLNFHIGSRDLSGGQGGDGRSVLVPLVLPKVLNGDGTAAGGNPGAVQVSQKGLMSIQIYGLNRIALVQARARMLRQLEFMQHLFVSLGEIATDLTDRIERDKARNLTGARRTRLEADIRFHEKIKGKIERLQKDILARFREYADPKAPYSAFARAWMETYRDG